MSYRGKKLSKQTQSLDKRNLIQEKTFTGIHDRGRGGRYRYLKRKEMKRLLQREADRRRKAEELTAKADALSKEASLYKKWCPEEAAKLSKEAELLRVKAEEVMTGKRIVMPEITDSLKSESAKTGSGHSSYIRFSMPSYSFARPAYKPDPQIAAISDAIRSGELNFMGGISYRINAVDTLKMISASSVFGEPQYYRDGENAKATILDGSYCVNSLFTEYSLKMLDPFKGMNTSQVMEKAIDEALSADFEATLKWAAELRERYLMRLNPQVILVRAAMHPGRPAFTFEHPGEFARISRQVMKRGDDVINQAQYWLALNGSKKGIPAILKRSWAQCISGMGAYTMAKYCNTGIGLVDVVRICHAKGPLVDTLMRKGRLPMPEDQNTWERLRASGMGWQDILKEIRMPHMALLRNLRGIFTEVRDPDTRENALELLKRGVRKGKQFPFRYLSAWKAVEETKSPWSRQVQDALEDCMEIACENLPSLKGRSAFLSDNSGSAWGVCQSEWGTMRIAEIGNLSSVIGAMCSEDGVVFPFGDRLESVRVHQNEGILKQAHQVGAIGRSCGGSTENGIWLFFRDAIMKKQHWDNIFIYSDMQAGHGGLFGIQREDYDAIGACVNGMYIDVNMLVLIYRKLVNPKVNVFCIQTAGYSNVLVPEYGYRTAVMYGWTGRELLFADAMNHIWNELETREPEKR